MSKRQETIHDIHMLQNTVRGKVVKELELAKGLLIFEDGTALLVERPKTHQDYYGDTIVSLLDVNKAKQKSIQFPEHYYQTDQEE